MLLDLGLLEVLMRL